MLKRLSNQHGIGLVELVVLLVVVGIMVAVALQSMTSTLQDIRQVKTEREMDELASAIVGDADLVANGHRTDFGYVGDIGSFPPNLDALITNPGGYTTWDGPYIKTGVAEDTEGFKTDQWGTAYTYSGGTTITSTGSGTSITKKIADATGDYLLNQISGTVVDSLGTWPGTTYADSIRLVVTIPNGTGSSATKVYYPDSVGNFAMDSLPVGSHDLDIIFLPANDTLHRNLSILPRNRGDVTYKFGSVYFDTTTPPSPVLEYVATSATVSGADCDKVTFDVINNNASDIRITSLTVTYASLVCYYKSLKLNTTPLFLSQNPRKGSGDLVTFASQTISAGETVTVTADLFFNNQSGNYSSKANMQSTSFTVDFSDGSSVSFSVGSCP